MYANALFDFIERSPAAPLALHTVEERLVKAGYQKTAESLIPSLTAGKYYFVRGGASIVALCVPEAPARAVIAAAHLDSPALRVKEGASRVGAYVSVPVERYGGLILYSWFDRPLSVAGRVLLSTESGVEERLVNVDRALAYIPNPGQQAPNNAATGATFNMAKDMLPLLSIGGAEGDLLSAVAESIGTEKEKIVSHDLIFYVRDKGTLAGRGEELLLCPRLDDLACAYAATEAFLTAKDTDTLKVLALFDHEEIGSSTERGADSNFLSGILSPFMQKYGAPFFESSLLVSADNAHAVHPNHPELSDNSKTPVMGGGIALKWSASHSYATDARAAAVFKTVCERAGVPLQTYQNRADIRGGSTLGSIADTHLGILAVDVGIPQLAMHSAVESCARADVKAMVDAIRSSLETKIVRTENGYDIG
ncbi:MAG: M18 family aminopeptidase [Clostridia bacterium]|nr:M18 family aminopeptidase [Clostridia bacterium]MBQ8268182.1 M18 family aminopeptidase [Clostridia bacterium]